MSSLHLEGNIICPSWYTAIKCGTLQKTDLVAIQILADILYWYRPTIIRDEVSGEIIEVRQKFKYDKLQKTYQQYSDLLGVTKERIKESIDNLIALNLVSREFRNIVTSSRLHLTNVMFLEPILESVKKITFRVKKLDVSDVLPSPQKSPPGRGEKVGEYPPEKVGEGPPENHPQVGEKTTHTYTEITPEINTETTTEITPLCTTNSVVPSSNSFVPKTKTEKSLREGEGIPLRTLEKATAAEDSSVEHSSAIPQSILDAIDPACCAYFGAYYPTARSFFEGMTITSADHIDQLMGTQKTIFEKYPVGIVCAVIDMIHQKRNLGELQYYNPTYFTRFLEEESDMQYVYTKFKQFCLDYFSANADALEVYNFYTTVLNSKEDQKNSRAREGISLTDRRISNVKALAEQYGLIEFLKMIRHYSQEFKQGKLRLEPSIARFSKYIETYAKLSKPNLKQRINVAAASVPFSQPVETKKVIPQYYERISDKYKQPEWEFYNWSYKCACGKASSIWAKECSQCHAVLDDAAAIDNFQAQFFKCTCGTQLHSKAKSCFMCDKIFDFEEALAKTQNKIKNDEGKKKDEHGANVQVCRDTGHRSTQQDC